MAFDLVLARPLSLKGGTLCDAMTWPEFALSLLFVSTVYHDLMYARRMILRTIHLFEVFIVVGTLVMNTCGLLE